jgi:hypothetical protein
MMLPLWEEVLPVASDDADAAGRGGVDSVLRAGAAVASLGALLAMMAGITTPSRTPAPSPSPRSNGAGPVD